MDGASHPDLDSLDRDALVTLFLTQQERIDCLIAIRDEELRRLEAELESHRQTLSEQADELRSRSERIAHLKLMVEKLRHVIFGTKSEKIVLKLEQMELELEDRETTQAELEAGVERVSATNEPKARPERKPFRSTFRVKLSGMLRAAMAVLIAAASCASLAKISPNSSSTSPRTSRSSATCGRSSLALVVIVSSRHRRHRDR